MDQETDDRWKVDMRFVTAFFSTIVFSVLQASAQTSDLGGLGKIANAPEMDAGAGIAAIALISACALLIYNRMKK